MNTVQALKDQINNLQINPSGEQFLEAMSAAVQSKNPKILINTYDKAMHLIPEFDGLNVKSFIGHIQVAVKSTQTTSLRHHRAKTHSKSEGHSKDRRYIKFSTAFRKIVIPVRKNSKSHCTGNTKRHVYPTI